MSKFNFTKFLQIVDAVYSLVRLLADVSADLIDDGKINGSNKKSDE